MNAYITYKSRYKFGYWIFFDFEDNVQRGTVLMLNTKQLPHNRGRIWSWIGSLDLSRCPLQCNICSILRRNRQEKIVVSCSASKSVPRCKFSSNSPNLFTKSIFNVIFLDVYIIMYNIKCLPIWVIISKAPWRNSNHSILMNLFLLLVSFFAYFPVACNVWRLYSVNISMAQILLTNCHYGSVLGAVYEQMIVTNSKLIYTKLPIHIRIHTHTHTQSEMGITVRRSYTQSSGKSFMR